MAAALSIATAREVQAIGGGRIRKWMTYGLLLATLVIRSLVSGWCELKGGLIEMIAGGDFCFLRDRRPDKVGKSKGVKIMATTIFKSLARLHDDDSGQGLVEYALIVGIVILAGIAASPGLSSAVSQGFSSIGSKIVGTIT